jgi:hypothetical protein
MKMKNEYGRGELVGRVTFCEFILIFWPHVLQIEWINQIQISILYELIVFFTLFIYTKLWNCEKLLKKSANLPHLRLRGKLAADDSPFLQNFLVEFWNLATQHLMRNLYANMPLKISDN